MKRTLYLVFTILISLSSYGQRLSVDKPCCTLEEVIGGLEGKVVPVNLRLLNNKPQVVNAQLIDGLLIYQGDIIVGTEKDLIKKAAILNIAAAEWPGSVIPYTIEAGYPDIDMIYYAINHIINNTNLCMVPRTTETDYVEFVNSGGCSSWIGMIGGMQEINLNPACGIAATIHEILHAAGHYHEQSRADRNTFVTINTNNITPANAFNFDQYNTGADVGSYDYESIMHYSEFAFSSNGQPTISINVPGGNTSTDIGQRIGLSAGDINAVNSKYNYMSPPACNPESVPANFSIKDKGSLTITGSTVVVSDIVVENTGNLPIALDSIWLVESRPSGGNFVVQNIEIPSLGAGATFTVPDFTLNNSSAGNGTYSYGIWIDPFNNVVEGFDNDNYHFWDAPKLRIGLNNICLDAIDIVYNTNCNPATFSNDCFTASGEMPNISCGLTGNSTDAWFKTTVPSTGELAITTFEVTNGLSDMVIEVYSGTCGALVPIAGGCDDNSGTGNHSKVILLGRAVNEVLYIRVIDSESDEYGEFGICVQEPPNCPNYYSTLAGTPPPNLLPSTQSISADYETDGNITSDQSIDAGVTVDYDSAVDIDLLPNFEVNLGAVFHAFIDGCGNLFKGDDKKVEKK